jgi:hypothetical protein
MPTLPSKLDLRNATPVARLEGSARNALNAVPSGTEPSHSVLPGVLRGAYKPIEDPAVMQRNLMHGMLKCGTA